MSEQPGSAGMVQFIWSVADLLRGYYKAHEYGQVVLPLTVLRRLDCVLEPTKTKVIARAAELKGKIENLDRILLREAGQPFYNTSPLDFARLLADPENIARNLRTYVRGFSSGATEVLDKYGFDNQITRLDNAGLLYPVVARFAEADLHPDKVDNHQMGYLFEELLRRFSEMSNETAGEHFTPREVIRLMVDILFSEDDETLAGTAAVRTMFDCACGTGGMLTAGQEHLAGNPDARLEVFGQELNPETWAIARSDLMIKGQDPSRIRLGNSLSDDRFAGQRFDYMIANPPFGVDWKRIQKQLDDEHKQLGHRGRFGAGLPRVSDGSLLFLQHLISKMKRPEDGGSRVAIVFSGSPLFSGGAGSGESEIRRSIIENDWLEAVVALPDQLFYNTGISTYFWVVTNRKSEQRRGKVVLLDARDEWAKMRKSLGDKRKYLPDDKIAEIVRLYGEALDPELPDDRVKVFRNEDFGYRRIVVERPKFDDDGQPVRNRKGLVPDPDLRDNENVPLTEDIEGYLKREVFPHVSDAWVDETKTRLGYEVEFAKHFQVFLAPRSTADITRELQSVEVEIATAVADGSTNAALASLLPLLRGAPAVRVKRLARVTYGLGQPPRLSEQGVPIIRATNIYRGTIQAKGLIFAAVADLPLDRAPLLKPGEILVVRSGAYTGDSALVTEEWAGSAPGYDLRLTPTGVEPRYLAHALLSRPLQQQIYLAKQRAAQPHLNAEDLGALVMALPAPDVQTAVADLLDAEVSGQRRIQDLRERQNALLLERRDTEATLCFSAVQPRGQA